jgi:ligand-binding sensor domain-containing protein
MMGLTPIVFYLFCFVLASAMGQPSTDLARVQYKENWNQDTMHKRNLMILAGNFVWSIAVAPDGTLWFGTDHGLSHFDGETWTTYTMEDGLPSTPITSIAVTADGKLWFSSGGGYISQYVPSD